MKRVGGAPVNGMKAIAAALAVAALSAGPAAAQKYRYRPLAPPPVQQAPAPPRLAIATLPADTRIAPHDIALDEIYEPVPDAQRQAALDAKVAALVPHQPYRPRPALWRVADRDTTIWLFGTVHMLPPGFRWRSPAVEAAAAGADTLIVESVADPAAGNPLEAKGDARLPPLAKRVNPSHAGKLAALTATLPPAAVKTLDSLPTWVAAVAVSVARDIRAGEVPGPGADAWFEAEFRRRGRPVVAIEDGARVAAAANAIPEDEARRMLDAALDAPPFDRARAHAPLHAWAQGRLGGETFQAGSLGSETLDDALLAQRNRAWAAALAARLRQPGRVLFAAGARHFTGRGSVIALLRARGLNVTRVD